ncbi:hypothetical protein SUGI_0675070 [Cryptomeria japonica]|nr:hypothetical protein SUGI_0675070 [Cryptomeria japonica]
MGQSPSKRAESVLKNSTSFKQATASAYNDCIALTQHAFQGVLLYQLHDACTKIYALLSVDPEDPAASFRQKWLPEPPTQLQIDETLRSKNLTTKGFLNLEEFEAFALALFRDMAISKACRTLGWYIPVGFVAIFFSHVCIIIWAPDFFGYDWQFRASKWVKASCWPFELVHICRIQAQHISICRIFVLYFCEILLIQYIKFLIYCNAAITVLEMFGT